MRIGCATRTSIHAARSWGSAFRSSSFADVLAHAGDVPRLAAEGVEQRSSSAAVGARPGTGAPVEGAGVVEQLLRLAALRAARVVPEDQVGHGQIVAAGESARGRHVPTPPGSMDDGARPPSRPPRRPGSPCRAGAAWPEPPSIARPRSSTTVNGSLDHLRPWTAWAAEPATEALHRRVPAAARAAVRGPPRLHLLDPRADGLSIVGRLRLARPPRPRRPRDRLLGRRAAHRAGGRHLTQRGRSRGRPSASTGSTASRSTARRPTCAAPACPRSSGTASRAWSCPRRARTAGRTHAGRGPSGGPTGLRADGSVADPPRTPGRTLVAWMSARSGCSTAASAGSPSPGR